MIIRGILYFIKTQDHQANTWRVQDWEKAHWLLFKIQAKNSLIFNLMLKIKMKKREKIVAFIKQIQILWRDKCKKS